MIITKILGKEITKYVKGHTALVIGTLIFTSLASLFAIVPAYLLKPFVDLGMSANTDRLTWEIPWIHLNPNAFWGIELIRKPILVEVQQKTVLFVLSAVALGAVLIRSLCSYLGSLLGAKFSVKVVNKIRTDLYQKFLTLHIGFYHRTKIGELVGRANADLSVMQGKISEILTGLIEYPVTAAAFLGYLLYMNYKLTITMFILAPVFIGILKLFGRKVKKHSERVQEALSELSQRYHEGITCIKIIQGFSKEQIELNKFQQEVESLYKKIMKWYRWNLGLGPFMDSVAFLAIPGILILGRVLFEHTLGEIVSIAFAFSRLYAPVKKLSMINNNLKTLQGAMKRVFEILNTTPLISEPISPIHLPSTRKSLEFRDVWFGYKPGKPVIKGIDLKIEAGSMVAIVGSTGAGKSTLLDLIPRFYDVDKGSILFDGVDIRDIPLKELRKQIGIVTQDTILFHDTIENNIKYGAQDKSLEEVIKVAKMALAHDFIMAQPNGYNTIIGDRGLMLSGGQRQRLAIARALIVEPSLLLLDEAASSLDAESERMIQETLESLRGKLTIIVVAHRLSSIVNSDLIVVLEDGKIVEMGSKDRLLSRNGRFKHLYSLQMASS